MAPLWRRAGETCAGCSRRTEASKLGTSGRLSWTGTFYICVCELLLHASGPCGWLVSAGCLAHRWARGRAALALGWPRKSGGPPPRRQCWRRPSLMSRRRLAMTSWRPEPAIIMEARELAAARAAGLAANNIQCWSWHAPLDPCPASGWPAGQVGAQRATWRPNARLAHRRSPDPLRSRPSWLAGLAFSRAFCFVLN